MTDYDRDYDEPGDRSSAWAAIEASRRAAVHRDILVRMGDCYLELARMHARLGAANVPKACGLCLKSADAYAMAGLSRLGQRSWRWARLLHRRRWREALQ